jgi:hypothetical protein
MPETYITYADNKKRCTKCHIKTDVEYFSTDSTKSDGLRCQCKLCENVHGRIRYIDNKKKISKVRKKYYKLHKYDMAEKTQFNHEMNRLEYNRYMKEYMRQYRAKTRHKKGVVMAKRLDLKVGQTVYVKENYSNELKKTTITDVGNKYFYCDSFFNIKFLIATMVDVATIGTSIYQVYLSKQEYKDDLLEKQLNRIYNDFFNTRSLHFSELKKIAEILKNTKSTNMPIMTVKRKLEELGL